jgi:trimeric autotransporter adhesin
MNRASRFMSTLLLLGGMLAVLPGAATAQVAKEGRSTLDGLAFASPRLNPNESLELIDDAQSVVDAEVANNWSAFRGESGQWTAMVDARNGRVVVAEGEGVPWIPGRGNKLSARANAPDLSSMEITARGFLPRVAAMLGVNPNSLVLNQGRSGSPADYLWFLDFDVVDKSGAVIEGARVLFRVNHGNLIQFGSENLPHRNAVAAKANLKREEALSAVASYIAGFGGSDSFIDGGSLHLIPVAEIDNHFGEGFAYGKGRGITPVWQFIFHREGVMGTWRARVDAATGEIIELADINDYAQATGGVYLNSPTTGSEVVRPMPFTNISSGGFTNSAGLYNFTGSAVTSSLAGQFVRISDTCGSISKSSDASGNLAFGTSTGTDCITPGSGGAGNTHASREQFYQVNRIKEVGRAWLPGNTWLTQQLGVNVNLNQTCNAYWNGSTLNFFRSGGGCRNTGELAGVSLHEYGHGLDSNDGNGAATEGGTGEAYGDITAAIALHASCIGPGFLGSNCGGYGDACTACTGVRDIDWAKRVSNTPATVSNFTQVRCPAGSGPCGKEVHCESYVPSQAVWDFANRDLPSPGSGTAWSILDRLWYLSRSTSTRSFACTTGTTFTSNGCSAGNWWKTMRAVDDDDGNLANGTPHGGALFAAFNRHGIACTTDTGASTTFRGCTPPATPTLSLTGANNSVGLSWTSSGSVYDVYRNETGCNAGFTKIANDVSATSLTDNAVANGLTYFYQIVAHPSGTEACGGTPSTCVSVTPGGPVTPDFTISASPSSLTVVRGNSGSSTVSTSALNGFNSAIALTASGQPVGVTVSFSPSSIAAPGTGSSTMSIAVASTTTVGSYTITVTGSGGAISHTTTVNLNVTSTNPPQQLLGNPGFETGTASPWVATAGVIDSTASQPARTGTWKAWLDGYGVSHTDTLYQQVTIPSTATSATLTFWLHIDTTETTTVTAFDTLRVQIRNSSNTVLATLATYSNLNKAAGYLQKSFSLAPYIGQTIRVYFLGVEDSSLQTSFVIDDTALNVQ